MITAFCPRMAGSLTYLGLVWAGSGNWVSSGLAWAALVVLADCGAAVL